MEILSNWVFWIILASIVFVLALIGYLTESMKKPKKDDKKEDKTDGVTEVTPEATTEVKPEVSDNWDVMPDVKPLEEVKVDTISDVNEVPSTNTEELFAAPDMSQVTSEVSTNNVEPVTEELNVNPKVTPVNPEVSTVNTDEVQPLDVQPTNESNTVAEPNTDGKNNDIWNL